MAKKPSVPLAKKLVILGISLIVFEGIFIFLFRQPEAPDFKQVLNKSINEKDDLSPERKAQMKIQVALNDYRMANGNYPKALDALVPKYFDAVPLNPTTAEAFKYTVDGDIYALGEVQKTEGVMVAAADPSKLTPAKTEEQVLIASLDKTPESDNYSYSIGKKKDPFRSFDFSPRDSEPRGDTPLEQFSYDELKLTAVLKGFDDPKAVVEDPQGKGHTVSVGMKLGPNGGEIVKIDDDRLVIVETTTDFTGEKKRETIEMFLRRN